MPQTDKNIMGQCPDYIMDEEEVSSSIFEATCKRVLSSKQLTDSTDFFSYFRWLLRIYLALFYKKIDV